MLQMNRKGKTHGFIGIGSSFIGSGFLRFAAALLAFLCPALESGAAVADVDVDPVVQSGAERPREKPMSSRNRRTAGLRPGTGQEVGGAGWLGPVAGFATGFFATGFASGLGTGFGLEGRTNR